MGLKMQAIPSGLVCTDDVVSEASKCKSHKQVLMLVVELGRPTQNTKNGREEARKQFDA